MLAAWWVAGYASVTSPRTYIVSSRWISAPDSQCCKAKWSRQWVKMLFAAVGLLQRFPHFTELGLERMKLTQHDLINIASLTQLTKLQLR
jgi:hypothetical protein